MGQGCPSRVNFNFAWKRNSIRTSCSIVINLALTRFGMLGRTWWHPLTKDKLDRLFYKLQALFYKLYRAIPSTLVHARERNNGPLHDHWGNLTIPDLFHKNHEIKLSKTRVVNFIGMVQRLHYNNILHFWGKINFNSFVDLGIQMNKWPI